MYRIPYKKIIFKFVGLLSLATFILSCRGITLSKLTHVSTASAEGHRGCCTSLGEKGAVDFSGHNLMWITVDQNNLLDLSTILEIIFVSIGFAVVIDVYDKNNSYIRAIRGRYGSFLLMNYFTIAFSRGVLNAKIF